MSLNSGKEGLSITKLRYFFDLLRGNFKNELCLYFIFKKLRYKITHNNFLYVDI